MKTSKKTHRSIFAVAAVLFAASSLASATVYTFNGTTSNATYSWSAGTNWDAVPVSASTTGIVLGTGQTLAASANVTTTQDIVSPPLLLNSLTTNYTYSAGAVILEIKGSALNFVSDGLTTPAIALNSTGSAPQIRISSAVNFGNDTSIGGSSDIMFLGNLTNTGGAVVTKAGTGTMRIDSNNPAYTGNFSVTGGTLQLGNADGNGDAGSGTVTLSGGGGFVVRRTGGTLTLNNTITGTGNVKFQTRNFTATINKANTYTGNTTLEPSSTVNAGGIKLGIDNGLPASTPFTINTIANGGNQTFDLNGHNQTLASLATGAGANATNSIITNSNAVTKTLTISGSSGSTTYDGLISGNITLTKSGGSTQVLTGNNTFTGNTTVSGGNLTLSSAGRLANTGNVIITAGGSLLVMSSNAVKTAAGVTMDGGTLKMGIPTAGGNQTFGVLTLSSNSTLDFADASGNTVWFTGSFTGASDTSKILTISNWTYGQDHLVFSSAPSSFVASQFNFGNGLTASYQGYNGGFEIVAIPEPGTIVAGALLLLSLIVIERWGPIRLRRLGCYSKKSPGTDGFC